MSERPNPVMALVTLACLIASCQSVADTRSAKLSASLAASAASGQESTGTLQWGASIRNRFESKQDFNFDHSSQDYVLTRTRLNVSYTTPAGNQGFIELQDARVAGESSWAHPPVKSKANANIFEDHLDIHQVNWNWKLDNANLTVGRQKLDMGDGRMVASLEWVNTARVSDGIRLTWGKPEKRQVDLFLGRPVAVDPDDFNDQARVGSRYLDSNFHGAFIEDHATLKEGQLQYWFFYRENEQFGDEVSTIGMRFTNEDLRWQPDLQTAYQFGRFGNNNHSAWMIHAGTRYNFEYGSLNLSYNFGSGDSDPSDVEHGTFDNLYPKNHPYYGYMDLFSLKNVHNLELSYTKQIGRGVRVYAGWNAFWLAEEDTDAWYHAGLTPIRAATTDVNPYVGNEIDITVQVPLFSRRVVLLAGISAFFAGAYLEDFGLTENALFYYLSTTYTIH